MDVLIEAAPAVAKVQMIEPVVTTTRNIYFQTLSLTEAVVSIARPSLGSHSLSAVAPDANLRKELALAGV